METELTVEEEVEILKQKIIELEEENNNLKLENDKLRIDISELDGQTDELRELHKKLLKM